jgi:hypothetical protein
MYKAVLLDGMEMESLETIQYNLFGTTTAQSKIRNFLFCWVGKMSKKQGRRCAAVAWDPYGEGTVAAFGDVNTEEEEEEDTFRIATVIIARGE